MRTDRGLGVLRRRLRGGVEGGGGRRAPGAIIGKHTWLEEKDVEGNAKESAKQGEKG